MAGSIQYIKISKIDKTGVDLTTQLESINTLVLPSGSSFAEYTIKNKSRFKDYFLYYVTPPDRNNISNDITSSLKYDFTGSLGGVGSEIDLGVGGVAVPYPTLTGTTGSKSITYDTTQERIQLTTSPQKDLHLRTSAFYVTSSAEVFVELFKANSVLSPGSITRLTTSEAIIAGGIKGPFTRQLSITGSNTGDVFFVGATADSFPFSGGPFVSVSGPLDGLKLTPFNIFISSSAATGDNLQTIIEPYFTTDFYRSEYDVLQNNATKGIPNQLLQNVDYNSGIIPTNIEAIMSGSAVKADIPQSNYEISSLINPSYNRSLVQSSDVNVYDPLARGTDFGDSINIGTYGQTPSISDLDTTIYEFEWGGGTTPEILDFGAIKMGRLLSTSSPDLIKTINPSSNYKNQSLFSRTPTISQSLYNINPKYSGSTSDYYLTLNGNNPINHRINMYLYNSTAGTNPTLPSTAKILTTDFGVPTISNYMVTSSYPTIYGKWGYLKDSIEFRFKTSDIGGNDPKFSRVNTGYVPGLGVNVASGTSGTSLTGNNTIVNEITTDINKGERWFMSMYFGTLESGFDSNDLVSLDSLNSILASPTADLRDINGNFINPLTRKGVVEILGANTGSTAYTASFLINTINDYKLQIPGFGSFNYDFNFGSGSWGFLMWKARAAGKNEFVIVQDSLSGGINAGAFTSAFVPEYLQENFEEITKEYGSNQTG